MADSKTLDTSELSAAFRQLKEGIPRTARRMVVAGGQIVKKEAKAIALANGSKRTGAMIKNIAIKREPEAPAGTEQYHVGVRHGRNLTKKQKSKAKLAVNKAGRIVKRYEDDPYYFGWVERGHKHVSAADADDKSIETFNYTQRLRNGKVVTRPRKRAAQGIAARREAAATMVPAKPFLAPAVERKQQAAIDAMGAELAKAIEKQGKA